MKDSTNSGVTVKMESREKVSMEKALANLQLENNNWCRSSHGGSRAPTKRTVRTKKCVSVSSTRALPVHVSGFKAAAADEEQKRAQP